MENDQPMITLFHSQGGFSFTASSHTYGLSIDWRIKVPTLRLRPSSYSQQ
jgi:hypothetical protein